MRVNEDLKSEISDEIRKFQLTSSVIEDLVSTFELIESGDLYELSERDYTKEIEKTKDSVKDSVIKLKELGVCPDLIFITCFVNEKRFEIDALLYFIMLGFIDLCEFLIEQDFFHKNITNSIFDLIREDTFYSDYVFEYIKILLNRKN